MEGTTPTPSIVVQHRSPECDPTATVQSKMRVAGTCRHSGHSEYRRFMRSDLARETTRSSLVLLRFLAMGTNQGRGRHHLANIATSPSGTATIDHLSAWWRIMPCSAVCLPTSVASVG